MKRSSRSVRAATLVLLVGFAAAFALHVAGASDPDTADARTALITGAGGTIEPLPVETTGFMIGGEVNRQLVPGRLVRMNLRLTNTMNLDLAITRLVVRITDVTKGGRTSTCRPENFVLRGATFATALALHARTNGSLRELGLHRTRWPKIGLLDLPVNQNECRGVRLTLSFAGSARPVRI